MSTDSGPTLDSDTKALLARNFTRCALLLLLTMFPPRAAAQAPPSAQRSVANPNDAAEDSKEPNDVPDPELIALTWQQIRQFNGKRIKQPVWRPDGTRLTDAETNELLDQVKSFQSHWWKPDELRPLVMVFRRVSPIKSGLSVAAVTADGHRLWSGTYGPFEPNGLTKTGCAPQVRELAKWPASVDLDVKVPLENPQIIKTIDKVPETAVEIAPGVRWYIDHDRGIEFKAGGEQQAHLTAAVLEVEDERPESLVFYESTVWLRDKNQPLSGGYVTMIAPRAGVWFTIRVSKPLDDVQAIERVEFTRQRFKIQRFESIKLRLDLLPPPDESDASSN